MKFGLVDFFFVVKSIGCIIVGNYKKCGFLLIFFLYFWLLFNKFKYYYGVFTGVLSYFVYLVCNLCINLFNVMIN